MIHVIPYVFLIFKCRFCVYCIKVKAWNDLFPTLVVTYHDGYIAKDLNKTTIDMQKIFYPYWWLQAVGYYNNFEDKINNFLADPAIIEFDPFTSAVTLLNTTNTKMFIYLFSQ